MLVGSILIFLKKTQFRMLYYPVDHDSHKIAGRRLDEDCGEPDNFAAALLSLAHF